MSHRQSGLKLYNSMLDLFNQPPPPTGEQLRDDGIIRAEDHADATSPAWSERAYQLLLKYIQHGREFRNEQFVEWAEGQGLSTPPTKRAFGAIVVRAAREGVIVRLRIDTAHNPSAHRGFISVWIKNTNQ